MSDVLVVGGGVAGCAAAEELTARGAAVTLVEPRGIGRGASQASAGMLVPFSEGRHDPVMEALGARSLLLYDAFIARLRAAGADVVYGRDGSLEVARDEDGARELAERAAAHAASGVASRLLDAVELAAIEPALSGGWTSGLLVEPHGFAGVPQLVAACWRAAASRGARLVESHARAIAPAGDRVRVTHDEGVLEARHVVLAAGSWSGGIEIAGVAAPPVKPVRGQLLHLRWRGVPPARIVWGPDCYTVPWPDGTLLVGATVEDAGFDERATASGVRALLDAATDLLPCASAAEFCGVRVGLRPGTPDDRPVLGASSAVPGLVYATGHYRNGVLLAPLTARVVADLVEGRPPDLPGADAISPVRFGPA